MNEDGSRLIAAIERWAGDVHELACTGTADAVRPDAPIGRPTPGSDRTPGALRASIRALPATRSGTLFRGRVEAGGPGVPQAATTDRGARPHVIRPRVARVLRFYSEQTGGFVFAREVNHPGNPPQNWWEPALRRHWPEQLRSAARSTPFG